MELRHLRYFVAVAEELHFRRAAELLHVAQPAVSEQVRKLEQELGVKLFDRTQRSVSLTVAGSAFLEESRHVLRHAEVAQHAARNAAEQVTMRLRVGYLPDSLPTRVPRALRHLAMSAPRVQVQLETGPALGLIEGLRAQRLDAVVTTLPAPITGLRPTPLDLQRAVAVLPTSHARARDTAIALDRLAPERLLMLPRDANPAFHNAVVAACHDSGLAPALVEAGTSRVEDVLLSVAAGAGMALLPDSVGERYATPGVRFVPIEGDEPVVQTAVLTHPDSQSLATQAFLHALAQAAKARAQVDARPVRALESVVMS
jgi:DNA-binding transcriptional LysR family regulator